MFLANSDCSLLTVSDCSIAGSDYSIAGSDCFVTGSDCFGSGWFATGCVMAGCVIAGCFDPDCSTVGYCLLSPALPAGLLVVIAETSWC